MQQNSNEAPLSDVFDISHLLKVSGKKVLPCLIKACLTNISLFIKCTKCMFVFMLQVV